MAIAAFYLDEGFGMDRIIIWNVDTQNDFMLRGGSLYVEGAEQIIPALRGIFDAAIETGTRVLGSADEHTADSAEMKRNGGPWPDHCMSGTYGQRNILPTLLASDRLSVISWREKYTKAQLEGAFEKQQVILTKDHLDEFMPVAHGGNPYASMLLKTIGPRSEIYVTGVVTEYCVKCAIERLCAWVEKEKNGCKIFLVKDAIKEISKRGMQETFEDFRRLGVGFASAQSLVEKMLRKK